MDALDDLHASELPGLFDVDEFEKGAGLGIFEVQRTHEIRNPRHWNLHLFVHHVRQRIRIVHPEDLQDASKAPPDLEPEVLQTQRGLGQPQRRHEFVSGDFAVAIYVHEAKRLLRLGNAQAQPGDGLLTELSGLDRATFVPVDLVVRFVDAAVLLHDAGPRVFEQQIRRHSRDGRQQLFERDLRVAPPVAADRCENGLMFARVQHADGLETLAEVLVGYPRIHVGVRQILGLSDSSSHGGIARGQPPAPQILHRPHRGRSLDGDVNVAEGDVAIVPEVQLLKDHVLLLVRPLKTLLQEHPPPLLFGHATVVRRRITGKALASLVYRGILLQQPVAELQHDEVSRGLVRPAHEVGAVAIWAGGDRSLAARTAHHANHRCAHHRYRCSASARR
mmetsp:Transcript_139139/g.444499  ORF Transcript_139139/g.444499 Transcript_139139/m.444499 type:complete len:391 (-) Transcript_139139:1043-2215(-)